MHMPTVCCLPSSPTTIQSCRELVVAGLLEGGVEFAIVALQGLRVGVGGQDRADRGGRARGSVGGGRVSGLRRRHDFQHALAAAPAQSRAAVVRNKLR
jgi:hypothetical protein